MKKSIQRALDLIATMSPEDIREVVRAHEKKKGIELFPRSPEEDLPRNTQYHEIVVTHIPATWAWMAANDLYLRYHDRDADIKDVHRKLLGATDGNPAIYQVSQDHQRAIEMFRMFKRYEARVYIRATNNEARA